MTENDKAQSYIYYLECKSCYLEFVIFSWKENWNEILKPFCPECGKQIVVCRNKVATEKPIWGLRCD